MKIDKCQVSIRIKNADGVKVTTPVAEAEYKVYDTVEEAVADLGPARTVEILNVQVKTLAMNDTRDRERVKRGLGEPSKTALKNQALARIDTPTMIAALTANPGRNPQDVLAELIAQEIKKIEAEHASGAGEDDND